MPKHASYDIVVIGSGFGGSMTALTLAAELKKRGKGERLLILERGSWWTTPVGTVTDPEVVADDFLKKKSQPVQHWVSTEGLVAAADLLIRGIRRDTNIDGLYDYGTFDGVSILRASGVGGGSLVYANVTIEPPADVFTAWPKVWADDAEREAAYDLARHAIGDGVLFAWDNSQKTVNAGLHKIATRTAALQPHFEAGTAHIDTTLSGTTGKSNVFWLDRARVFQTAMHDVAADPKAKLTEYGTVDSSINDLKAGDADPAKPVNYCERQGRCIIGCLPGARQTLNKQLLRAMYGNPTDAVPVPDIGDALELEALVEVERVEKMANGYAVHIDKRDAEHPLLGHARSTVTAKIVIIAAGCVGTNELMLRSAAAGGLPDVSPHVGERFSTNGDYLGFLEDTDKTVSLTRGPVTTSFAHFSSGSTFHTIEDNGIPRPLAGIVGFGVPLMRALADGASLPKLLALVAQAGIVQDTDLNRDDAGKGPLGPWHRPRSGDELTANMMCVAGMGRAQSNGKFSLGPFGKLKLAPMDGTKAFPEDPIYDHMRASLNRFAVKLKSKGGAFTNPTLDQKKAARVGVSHPLGGCIMADGPKNGVVNTNGAVFDTTDPKTSNAVHKGLFIADAAIIPSSLGVNPSLTISALALHIAKHIRDNLDALLA